MNASFPLLTATLLAIALSAPAQAETPPCKAGRLHSAVSAVAYDAPDKAAPSLERVGHTSSESAQIVELPLAEAKALLSSTEGPAWHVFQVNAPDCSPADLKKVRKAKAVTQAPAAEGCEAIATTKYVVQTVPSTSECRQIKKDCATATQFAEKFNRHATCSTLYTRTTVLLSTDSALKQPHESLD